MGPSLINPETLVCPYDYYKKLRAESPVLYVPEIDMWIVSRYEDGRQVLNDADTFSNYVPYDEMAGDHSLATAFLERVEQRGWRHVPVLQQADGDAHARYRRFVNQIFKPSWVRGLEPDVMKVTHDLIERFIDRGECEFVSQFAVPMPGTIIATQVGLPADQIDTFRRWASALLAPADGKLTSVENAIEMADVEVEAQEFFAALFEERRRNPTGDLISSLVAEVPGEEPLSDYELQGLMWQMVTGGFETTTDALSMGMWLLATYPDEGDRIRNDRSLIKPFIEEVLRLGPPVSTMFRRAVRDVEICDQRIPAGSVIGVRMGATNRDEAVFSDGEEFIVGRENAQRHLSFGQGPHFCVGAPLARREMDIAFNAILDRMDNVALVTPGEPERDPSFVFFQIARLPITFTAR